MKILSNENKGSLYCTISGLLYGLIGYFGANIMDANISAFNMLFWRFLIASIFILIVLLPNIHKFQLKFSDVIIPLALGGIFYGVGSGIYFISTRHIGTGLSMVIFFTYPLMIILGNALLYKERITRIYYVSVFMIIIGMIFLVDINEFKVDLYGVILALLSALGYAAYIAFSKKQTEDLPPIISTLMVCLGSCASCLLISIFDNSFVVINSYNIWGHILGLAIICTVIPILLMIEGLQYISAAKAGILSVLEPVGVFIIGTSILDEKVTLLQSVGVIIILIGALVVQFGRIKHK